jgi:hypothetical protein
MTSWEYRTAPNWLFTPWNNRLNSLSELTNTSLRRAARGEVDSEAASPRADFFNMPTTTFRVLFVLVVLSHHRRRVVHFRATEHPAPHWTTQQIREAFPWDQAPKHVLRDRDSIYGTDFAAITTGMGIAFGNSRD